MFLFKLSIYLRPRWSYLTLGLSIAFVCMPLKAQEEYSLGNTSRNNGESSPANSDIIPQGDFISGEQEDLSLFGDEPETAKDIGPIKPPENGISKGLGNDPAAAPVGNGKSRLLPIPATKSAVSSNIVPQSNVAPITSSPSTTLPIAKVPEASPPGAVVPAPTLPSTNPMPAEASANGFVSSPSENLAKPQNFNAPLQSDGSIAPVRLRDPLAPNNFSGVPPLPGSRRGLAKGQAPEFYQVEAGDTLFDVCSQLIDDGNYWPRLWSMNFDIKNPHFIYPGMKLVFYPGDATNPPYIDVVEEDDMIPVDKGALKESELVAQVIDIPELPKSNANVLSGEEPVEVIGPEGVESDSVVSDIFETGGQVYADQPSIVVVPAFIFPEERQQLGVVQGALRGERRLSGDGDDVIVSDSSNLPVGATLTVLRPRGEINHPVTRDVLGYRYDFVSNVQIQGKINEERYLGQIKNSYLGTLPGDIIVNFMSTKRTYENNAQVVSGAEDASIVGLEGHQQRYAGEGGVVFLDKGRLNVGSSYPVFQKSTNSLLEEGSASTLSDAGKHIGVIKVIDSSEKYAVAVILHSSSEIRVGDKLSAR